MYYRRRLSLKEPLQLEYTLPEEIDIDNWVFELYYQGSFVIFLLGSMIGVMSQYFGKPISCDFQGVDRSMAAEYCWIHGSSYIPRQYQKHMRCSIDMTGDKNDKAYFITQNETSYLMSYVLNEN